MARHCQPQSRVSMQYRFLSRIADVTAAQWNAVTGTHYPFLRHEFLHALESSGSVTAQRGWQPLHLIVEQDDRLLAVMPLYIKTHSMGEFVFDHSWAEAFRRYGYAYYPKLLIAVPFTPATGPRLAHTECDQNELLACIGQALNEKIQQLDASSWHVLFAQETEFEVWQQLGGAERIDCQFQWHNRNYRDFNDFLNEFASRKRKSLRKERERLQQAGLQFKRLRGEQISAEHWQHFYRFYQLTNYKYNRHGGYLTDAFFTGLHAHLRDQLLLVLAYQNDEPVAGALNFYFSDTLYGRYWGCVREIEYLHFETCYYQGIEFCIEQGLKRFDPGVQGEHKLARGFEPVLTHSFHFIEQPAFRQPIQHFLAEEADYVRRYQQEAQSALPFKQRDGG